MKHSLFLMILLLSLSCTSRSQAKRDSIIDTLSDSLSATDSISPTDTLRLLFVGDLMQHQGQINAARTSTGYDYSTCFTYVKEEIGRADLAIANLEVTLGGKPYKGYPAFSAPDEFLTAIHDAGFNVLVTANNHSLRPWQIRIGAYHSTYRLVENSTCRHVYQHRRTRQEISSFIGKERVPHRPAQLYVWHKRYPRYSSQYRELY